MNDWVRLVEAAAIGIFSGCLGLIWWKFRKRAWIAHYGNIATYFAVVVFVFLMLGPIEWCISLLPPVNDPGNPTYLGIGGGGYGKDYGVYPRAMLWWSIMALSVLALTDAGSLWTMAPNRDGRASRLGFRRPRRNIVNRWSVVIAIATLAAVLKLFNDIGWDRLIWSDLGRFDVEDGSLGAMQGVRWILPTFLTTGALASLLLFLNGSAAAFLMTWVLSIVPFLVFQSRGITILFLLAGASIYFRFRRYRRLAIIPLVLVIAVSAWLPLRLREEQSTGLKVVWNVLTNQTQETKKFNGWNMVILLMQNAGQGFGVFCEVISGLDAPGQRVAEIPDGYILTSFSPLPSAIDGFAERYSGKDPRVNPFTPYSAFAELVATSTLAFFVVPAFISFVSIAFLVQPRNPTKLWIILSMLVALLILNGWVQATQYAIRTSGRFIYCGWFLGSCEIVLRWIVDRLPKRKNGNP